MEVEPDDGGVVPAREIKSGPAHDVDERVYLARLNLSHYELRFRWYGVQSWYEVGLDEL